MPAGLTGDPSATAQLPTLLDGLIQSRLHGKSARRQLRATREAEVLSIPDVVVDPGALEELARRLSWLADALAEEVENVRHHALAGLGAVPPSDLGDTYGYCWGRWSQFHLDRLKELRRGAEIARLAAATWQETERANAQAASQRAGKETGG